MNSSKQTEGLALQLYEAASMCRGEAIGQDVFLNGVCTDTRHIIPGSLFVALRGERFDGHKFVEQALKLGAAAVMIDHDLPGVMPALRVTDTRKALGSLAAAWRRKFNLPVIAVTGSNGKTTVKEMVTSILSVSKRVLATRGNLNNDIGVPLTLCRLDQSYQAAVIEMGANHAGEIAYLDELAKPDIAVITNAAAAHLEGFGSLQGVAEAKGEIYAGLELDGVAVVNADDRFFDFWCGLAAPRKTLSFGLSKSADVTAEWRMDNDGSRVQLHTPQGDIQLTLKLLGEHNVMNALAATSVTIAANESLENVKAGLEAMLPVNGRLQLKPGKRGSRIIDDTYNANPASYLAALNVLKEFAGRRILVLGDMAELGEDEEELHRQAGRQARQAGIEAFFTLGNLAEQAAKEFGSTAQSFDEHDTLVRAIDKELSPDTVVLVKGSRRMQMDRVVVALEE